MYSSSAVQTTSEEQGWIEMTGIMNMTAQRTEQICRRKRGFMRATTGVMYFPTVYNLQREECGHFPLLHPFIILVK
jgi:hypothetical protein